MEGLEDRERSSEEASRRVEASLGGVDLREARRTEASAGHQKETLDEPDAIEEERALLCSVVAQAPSSFDPATMNPEIRRLKLSTCIHRHPWRVHHLVSRNQPVFASYFSSLSHSFCPFPPHPSRVRTPCRAHTRTCKRFTPGIHSFPVTTPVVQSSVVLTGGLATVRP